MLPLPVWIQVIIVAAVTIAAVWQELHPKNPAKGEVMSSDIDARIDVDGIAEEAMQAGFKVMCDRIDQAVGGHTYGDVDPLESYRIDQEFRGWVRMMAENNTVIQAAEVERQCDLDRAPRCECGAPWDPKTGGYSCAN